MKTRVLVIKQISENTQPSASCIWPLLHHSCHHCCCHYLQSWPTSSCTISLQHNVVKIWIMRTQGKAIQVTSAPLEQQWTASLFEIPLMSHKQEVWSRQWYLIWKLLLIPKRQTDTRTSNYRATTVVMRHAVDSNINQSTISSKWNHVLKLTLQFLTQYFPRFYTKSVRHLLKDA